VLRKIFDCWTADKFSEKKSCSKPVQFVFWGQRKCIFHCGDFEIFKSVDMAGVQQLKRKKFLIFFYEYTVKTKFSVQACIAFGQPPLDFLLSINISCRKEIKFSFCRKSVDLIITGKKKQFFIAKTQWACILRATLNSL